MTRKLRLCSALLLMGGIIACSDLGSEPGIEHIEIRYLSAFIGADMMPVVPPDPNDRTSCTAEFIIRSSSGERLSVNLRVLRAGLRLSGVSAPRGTLYFFSWSGVVMTISSPTIRVLLADDHAIVRAGIRQVLEHASDIQVVAEASDVEVAQSLIRQHQPDVAVLDIQMPKASGIEVTRWVRANFKDVGVLVLTAYDDDPYVMAVLQAGANGYVLKTASPEELIQAVRDVHEGKSALDPSVAQKLMSHYFSGSKTPLVEQLTDRELEVFGK